MKLKIGQESATVESQEMEQLTAELDEMINDGSNEENIRSAIHHIQERYSDYGRDRRSAISFHLNALKRCLQPTQTTKTILWLMSCVPQFHHSTDGSPIINKSGVIAELWYSMLEAINPTAEQNQRMVQLTMGAIGMGNDADNQNNSQAKGDGITDMNGESILPAATFAELKMATDETSSMINRIEGLLADKNESVESEMKKLQGLFNARQIAKFIIWVQKNPACMQMLEALWPHVQSSFGYTSPNNNNNNNISNSDAASSSSSSSSMD